MQTVKKEDPDFQFSDQRAKCSECGVPAMNQPGKCKECRKVACKDCNKKFSPTIKSSHIRCKVCDTKRNKRAGGIW